MLESDEKRCKDILQVEQTSVDEKCCKPPAVWCRLPTDAKMCVRRSCACSFSLIFERTSLIGCCGCASSSTAVQRQFLGHLTNSLRMGQIAKKKLEFEFQRISLNRLHLNVVNIGKFQSFEYNPRMVVINH